MEEEFTAYVEKEEVTKTAGRLRWLCDPKWRGRVMTVFAISSRFRNEENIGGVEAPIG